MKTTPGVLMDCCDRAVSGCGDFSVSDLSTFKKIAVTSALDCNLYKTTHQVNAVYPN